MLYEDLLYLDYVDLLNQMEVAKLEQHFAIVLAPTWREVARGMIN